jgi:capsular polysaccharide transport system ATP-binding protein
MIHLVNLSKSYHAEDGTKVVIRPTSLTLPVDNRRIAVLGASNTGKSVLVRLICGAEDPTTGRVVRKCTVSWPFGSPAGISFQLTGAENVRFVSRIYGADFGAALALVEEVTELGPALHEPLLNYPAAMRGKLIYSLSLAIDFDCYLLDEIMFGGDVAFRKKYQKILDKKFTNSGMLFFSQNERKVKEYCESALVLHHGRLFPFESLAEATEFYGMVKPQ